MKIVMNKSVCFIAAVVVLIFFSAVPPTLHAKSKKVPQRVILLKASEPDKYQRYIELEMLKTLEELDSALQVRYMKEAEYQVFNRYLYDQTSDDGSLADTLSLKEFYLKTGTRGVIYATVTRTEYSIQVLITLYQVFSEKIDIKELQYSESTFFKGTADFGLIFKDAVEQSFPLIEVGKVARDRVRILKVVRDAPDFRLDLAGKAGYLGRYYNFGEDETDNNVQELLNGPLFGFQMNVKVKSLSIDTGLDFVPYVTGNKSYNDINFSPLWFSLYSHLFMGGYFIGDLVALGGGMMMVVETVDGPPYSWPVHLRFAPSLSMEINPVDRISFTAKLGPNIVLLNTGRNIVFVTGAMFSMLIKIFFTDNLYLVTDIFLDMVPDGLIITDPASGVDYDSSYFNNRLVIGFGYRWNWKKGGKK
jgi:hypothetical protein